MKAESRDAANAWIQDLEESGRVSNPETTIIEREDRIRLEFRFQRRLNKEDRETLATLVDERSKISDLQMGLTDVTLTEIVESVRSSLSEVDAVSKSEVFHVQTESSAPDYVAADVTVSENEDLIAPQDTAIHLKRVDGKTMVFNTSDYWVTNVEVSEDGSDETSLTIQHTKDSQRRYEEFFNGTDGWQDVSIRLSHQNETVWGGKVSPRFYSDVTSGDWDGSLLASSSNETVAEKFAKGSNLVTVSVPSKTEVERC